MKQILTALQIVFSVLLITLVLIQARGTGFGRNSTGSFARRGLEKIVFKLTFTVAGLFILVSVLQLYV